MRSPWMDWDRSGGGWCGYYGMVGMDISIGFEKIRKDSKRFEKIRKEKDTYLPMLLDLTA